MSFLYHNIGHFISCRKYFFGCIAALFAVPCFSQNGLFGKVIDATTGVPISSASVYLNNTSIGTQTDGEGKFLVKSISGGNLILVVSSIGYETWETQLKASDFAHELTVRLHQQSVDLDKIVVTAYEKDGWKRWGDIFLQNLIGNSSYAHNCKLANHDALKFRMRHKDSTLFVYADEPLVIINHSLGYEVHFDLKHFELNFSDSGNTLSYSGHPFFSELTAKSEKERKQFMENRKKAYQLSLMRFMRSLFSQSVNEEYKIQQIISGTGFNILVKRDTSRASSLMTEAEADTVYEIGSDMVNIRIIKIGNNHTGSGPNQNQPNSLSPAVGNIFAFNAENISMYFSGTLSISINKTNMPSEYLRFLGLQNSQNGIVSEIELKKDEPVFIYSNGNYVESTNLRLKGFWSWWEKLATMLPLNYEMAQ